MTTHNDEQLERLVESLDQELERVDRETLDKLAAARMSALNNIKSNQKSWYSGTNYWLPGISLASVMIAVLLYLGSPSETQNELAQLSVAELEWLFQEDDLQLMQEDIAFYDWVESEIPITRSDS